MNTTTLCVSAQPATENIVKKIFSKAERYIAACLVSALMFIGSNAIGQTTTLTYTTPGTTSFTVPSGVSSITVYTWGAGGGSGGVTSGNDFASGGGGGGAFSGQTNIAVTGGVTMVTVTVGAGGVAGLNTGTSGGTGGSSSVTVGSTTYTANGGGGGGGATSTTAGTAGTGAAAGSGYTTEFGGGNGTVGVRNSNKEVGGAGGGGAGNAGAGGNGISGTAGTNTTGGTGGWKPEYNPLDRGGRLGGHFFSG